MAQAVVGRLPETNIAFSCARRWWPARSAPRTSDRTSFLYSKVSGLVFARLFFPFPGPLVGTLEDLAISAVGFVARPVGGAILGITATRIGRKGCFSPR
jgi:hypothetical protein